MKSLFIPFEKVTKNSKVMITLGWFVAVIGFWLFYSVTSDRHLFPTLEQVGTGFVGLWNEGLMTHVLSSLWLCAKSVFLAVLLSLLLVYLSPLPLLKPVATFLSKLRFLPLTGISFYLAMVVDSGREIQVWILVIFMSTYLITSLLSMIRDIKEEEFDHARALGCSRWEVLYEVVIKGRLDYVLDMIRQNVAIVWMFLVTVESILAAGGGLGFIIKNSDKFLNHGRIVALQIIILLIGLGLDYFVNLMRKSLFRYSKI